jgi:hypothetical protein
MCGQGAWRSTFNVWRLAFGVIFVLAESPAFINYVTPKTNAVLTLCLASAKRQTLNVERQTPNATHGDWPESE